MAGGDGGGRLRRPKEQLERPCGDGEKHTACRRLGARLGARMDFTDVRVLLTGLGVSFGGLR